MSYKASLFCKCFFSRFRLMLCALALGAAMCGLPQAAMAKTASLKLTVGPQKTFDRVMFDWDQMVAYAMRRDGDTLYIAFEAITPAPPPMPSGAGLRHVRDIRLVSQDAQVTIIGLDLAAGAQVKDYRLTRNIVFDVFGSDAPVMDTPVTDTPVARAPAVPARKPVEVPPIPSAPPAHLGAGLGSSASPVPDPPPVKAVPVPAVEDRQAEAAPVDRAAADIIAAVEAAAETGSLAAPISSPPGTDGTEHEAAPALPAQPTVLTISTIEPTPIAVFERFGYLWVIVGSKLGTIEPESFGPLAARLGRPDTYNLDGGIAYRYPLPQDVHVNVVKKSLAWQVMLSAMPAPAFSAGYIEAVFDDDGTGGRLVMPFDKAGTIMAVTDPAAGDTMYVVPSLSPAQRLERDFLSTDVHLLDTYLGFAAVPKRADLRLDVGDDDITISADQGLHLSPPRLRLAQIHPFTVAEPDNAQQDIERLFNLRAWRKGGLDSFARNRLALLGRIADIDSEDARINAIFQLALLYFSNGFGDEALGLLDIIEEEDEALSNRLSFLAIRGAAKALAGRYDDAIDDLGTAALQDQPEARLWRGYAAAANEEWRLAESLFPKNPAILSGYPQELAIPLTLYMAESALRSADPARASKLLEALDVYEDSLPLRHHAARLYLQGEMFRQNNQPEKALELWGEAIKYRDRLYQTKARLAKTLLEWQQKKITPQEALDTMEHMRFAWRDDALETQILQSIGLLRVVNGRYYDGLVQLKSAVRLAEARREDTAPLTTDMLKIFRDLYVNGRASDIPPLEAVSIYTEFPELIPGGEEGTLAAQNYADYLVEMDLLERAAETLERLLSENSVQGQDITKTGARLAAIYLLDDRPNEAISVLQRTGRPGIPAELEEERGLLRARALSQLDMTAEAIQALSGYGGRNAMKLRADIYWRAEQWAAAAGTLLQLVPPPSTDALSPEEAGLVLNSAVAYKLAGDTGSLETLKRDYMPLMQKTALANSFNVITRAAGQTTLADRETMLQIAGEVDIFSDFLNSYRGVSADGTAEPEDSALE